MQEKFSPAGNFLVHRLARLALTGMRLSGFAQTRERPKSPMKWARNAFAERR